MEVEIVMDGNWSPELTQILNAIKDGGFERDELVQHLNALVDRELSQNDHPADMVLVEACQDMLYRLHHHGEVYTSHCADSLAKAKAKAKRHSHKSVTFPFRPVIRVVAVFVLLVITCMGYDLIFRGKRLSAVSTPDEQQYVVDGNKNEGLLIVESNADSNLKPRTVSTTELDEAIEVLGYTPKLPTWLPDGWYACDYFVVVSKQTTTFRAQYCCDGINDYIKYIRTSYHDADIAQARIEQDKAGTVYSVNGNNVYVTQNIDSTVATWLSNSTCYTVLGPISETELMHIVESILNKE